MSSRRDRERRRKDLRDQQKTSQRERKDRGGPRLGALDLSKANGEVKWFKPDKRNHIGFVPFEVQSDQFPSLRRWSGKRVGKRAWSYKLEIPIHRNIGPDSVSFFCPKAGLGGNCFVCEQKQGLSYPADKAEIKAHSPTWRTIYNVEDYNEDDGEVYLWDVSYELFEKEMLDEIDEIEIEEDTDIIVSDFEESHGVKFRGTEKTMTTEQGQVINFLTFKSFDFPKRDDLSDDILSKAHPLDLMLRVPTYEDTKNIYLGIEEEEEVAEEPPVEEEEERKPRRTKPPKEEKEEERPKKKELGWNDLDDMDHDEMMEFMSQEDIRIRGAKRKKERELRKELEKLRPEQEPKEKEEKPRKQTKKDENEGCPAGHEFGADCDEKPECDDCDVWQECAAEQDRLRSAG